MFPITIDVVTAERSRRLEGFANRSRRRLRSADSDTQDAQDGVGDHRPDRRHPQSYRPALGH